MATPLVVPTGLARQRLLGEAWGGWLDALPGTYADLLGEWDLAADGPARHGATALVSPVRTRDGEPAMLKIGFDGDSEAALESLALQHWAGRGAVRLLRASPRRRALLLERLHSRDLTSLAEIAACETVAGLYGRLHRPALPQLTTLSAYLSGWLEDLARLPASAPIPRRMVARAASTGRELLVHDTQPVLLHVDLHFQNVLAADREPWLVIDPKPLAGDRNYEVAPMLWNRWEEMLVDCRLRDRLRRRFHTIVDVAGLDEDRARAWVVVRMVVNALWTLQAAERAGRGLEPVDQEWISRCVAIVKAIQD